MSCVTQLFICRKFKKNPEYCYLVVRSCPSRNGHKLTDFLDTLKQLHTTEELAVLVHSLRYPNEVNLYGTIVLPGTSARIIPYRYCTH
jgi:hypothetical protein